MSLNVLNISMSVHQTPIPYHAAKREDGENYGYFSLVKNPEFIDQIPELFEENEMKEFIRNLNGQDGIFETIRMLHWYGEKDGKQQRILCFGFTFRNRALFNNLQNCFKLCERLYFSECNGN